MKFLLVTAFAIFAASFGVLCAQEPPLPAQTETPTPSPIARPQLDIPDIPLPVEPPQLVPNTSPAPSVAGETAPAEKVPALSELDAAFKRSSLGQAEEEKRLHIEWRKLQNRTAHNPEVVAAKEAAGRARTDLEKRNRLRAYYNIFYAKMQALADSPELNGWQNRRLRTPPPGPASNK